MPYSLRKVSGKNCYRVSNKKNKKVFSKCTSRNKAKRQLRLLRAIQNNKNFISNSSKRRTRKAN
jgi:hypothetical protein